MEDLIDFSKYEKVALPCRICQFDSDGKCSNEYASVLDALIWVKDCNGKYICPYHVNKFTSEKTGGFKLVEKMKLEKKDRQKVWFISDCHFSHESILFFHPWRRDAAGITLEELHEDKRAATEKHDEWLINKWNETIGKHDIVYHLGDFCMKNKERAEKILKRLHGKKYMIRGNHDKPLKGLENYFEWIGDIKEVKFTNNQFKFVDPNEPFCVELCHYPMLTWNRRPHGTIMVHGHCHGNVNEVNRLQNELRVDVGLDSDVFSHEFVEVEALYNYFKKIVSDYGCNTFQEFIDKRMLDLGYRS